MKGGPGLSVVIAGLVSLAAALLGACDDPAPSGATDPGPGGTVQHEAAARRVRSRRVELTPGDGPLRAQLEAHARDSRAAGLVPVAYGHAEWCGPCQAVARYANDPAMRDAFVGISVAGIDVDRWATPELRELGIGDVLPTWYALGEGGRPSGRAIDGGAWADDVPPNMAPALAAFFGGLRGRR